MCISSKIARLRGTAPCRATPEVVIEVLGGVASVQSKSKGVQITIRDYDNQQDCEISQEYSEEIWDESDKV